MDTSVRCTESDWVEKCSKSDAMPLSPDLNLKHPIRRWLPRSTQVIRLDFLLPGRVTMKLDLINFVHWP